MELDKVLRLLAFFMATAAVVIRLASFLLFNDALRIYDIPIVMLLIGSFYLLRRKSHADSE